MAELDQLHPMLLWIRNRLIHLGFDLGTIRKVELASEEALVNIIHHAYKKAPGKIEIDIKVIENAKVEIAIKDSGPPFDPLGEPTEIDRHAPLEERKVGGLGIHLMRQYMDEVRYFRDGDINTLFLVKNFPKVKK
ncbi:MAG: ATP-binding protein [Chlamydiota bacterium]